MAAWKDYYIWEKVGKKMKILCSTGALIGKANNRNYRLLERLAKELTCDGFEFMMYSSWYDEMDDMISYLKALNIYIPVVHCEKHIGQSISAGTEEEIAQGFELFEKNCRLAKELSAEKLVLHLWDGIISDSNFDSNLDNCGKLMIIAKEYGLDLLIENVVCNVKDPMTRWCQLMGKYPDIHFVFDTKMAAFHGQLNLLYEKDYECLWKDGHICHYHINDYGGGIMDWANLRTLPIGKGNIDFNDFSDFLKKIGYSGMATVEATAFDKDGKIDVEMLNECFAKIREW